MLSLAWIVVSLNRINRIWVFICPTNSTFICQWKFQLIDLEIGIGWELRNICRCFLVKSQVYEVILFLNSWLTWLMIKVLTWLMIKGLKHIKNEKYTTTVVLAIFCWYLQNKLIGKLNNNEILYPQNAYNEKTYYCIFKNVQKANRYKV